MPLELGSSVAYASLASIKNNYKDGINTTVISKIGYDFPDEFLKILKDNNISLKYIIRAKCKSTRYVLIYKNEERISLKLTSICEKITKEDIPEKLIKENKIIYFALIANEIDLDLFKWIKTNYPDKLICLDIQGVLRFKKPDNSIYLKINKEIINALKYIDILKLADYEAKIIVDSDNFEYVAKKISEYGPKIVIITSGYKGSLIYDSENDLVFKIPAVVPDNVIDVTGTGDTYFSSFLSEYYKTNDLKHSGLYAATFVYFLVQKEGLNGMPTRDEVLRKLDSIKDLEKNMDLNNQSTINAK